MLTTGYQVSLYVKDLLGTKLASDMYFHNLSHTLDVVESATQIALQENITTAQIEILQIAAWFHDTGYCNAYLNHEDYSIDTATGFLSQHISADKGLIDTVVKLISATRFPQKPTDSLSAILCDADLAHLAKINYHSYEKRLRKEWAAKLTRVYTNTEWQNLNIAMMSTHQYFTGYAQKAFEHLKQKNIGRLYKSL